MSEGFGKCRAKAMLEASTRQRTPELTNNMQKQHTVATTSRSNIKLHKLSKYANAPVEFMDGNQRASQAHASKQTKCRQFCKCMCRKTSRAQALPGRGRSALIATFVTAAGLAASSLAMAPEEGNRHISATTANSLMREACRSVMYSSTVRSTARPP